MFEVQRAVRALRDAAEPHGEVAEPEQWIYAERVVRFPVEAAAVRLRFDAPPPAAALATALVDVDRAARRTATALDRRVPPSALFGRGTRLVPPAQGLVVEDARPGSLDVDMLLGGIFGFVVGQPMSFVLNVASLLQYGRLAIRAILPSGGNETAEVQVAPTVPDRGDRPLQLRGTIQVPTPHGMVSVPESFRYVRIEFKSTDGTRLEFEARPDAPRGR